MLYISLLTLFACWESKADSASDTAAAPVQEVQDSASDSAQEEE